MHQLRALLRSGAHKLAHECNESTLFGLGASVRARGSLPSGDSSRTLAAPFEARSCGSCFEVERSHDIALPCRRVHLRTEPPRWHGMAWHGIVSHILLEGSHSRFLLFFSRLLRSLCLPRTIRSNRRVAPLHAAHFR